MKLLEAKKDIGEPSPKVTNPAGNHFVGPLTTDSDVCAGCADGQPADVGASAARARLKGFSDYLIFDEDSPDALWRIGSANEVFFFDDLTYGTLDVVAFDPGAPSNSLRISSSGSIGIGAAAPAGKLHVMGDAILEGNVALGSSRELKSDFAPVASGEILAKLLQLPIHSWRFKDDARQARHLGPVAEDFAAAFGLGSDANHISPLDTAGIAFAAIQGLGDEVEQLRRENRRLRSAARGTMVLAAAGLLTALTVAVTRVG